MTDSPMARRCCERGRRRGRRGGRRRQQRGALAPKLALLELSGAARALLSVRGVFRTVRLDLSGSGPYILAEIPNDPIFLEPDKSKRIVVNIFSTALANGRAGSVTNLFGIFRPGQSRGTAAAVAPKKKRRRRSATGSRGPLLDRIILIGVSIVWRVVWWNERGLYYQAAEEADAGGQGLGADGAEGEGATFGALGPGRLGAVKRPQRFPMKDHSVWGFCMGAQGAYTPKTPVSGPGSAFCEPGGLRCRRGRALPARPPSRLRGRRRRAVCRRDGL
jgi:hypothetical protein